MCLRAFAVKKAFFYELPHHEERVYAHVEQKRGKQVTSVAVVPHEDLKRDHDRRIEQEYTANEEHGCTFRARSTRSVCSQAETAVLPVHCVQTTVQ